MTTLVNILLGTTLELGEGTTPVQSGYAVY